MKQENALQYTALLLEHLAAATRQGMALHDIIQPLAQAAQHPAERRRLAALDEALRQGAPLGAALQPWPGLGDPSVAPWLADAQARGALADALVYLAQDLQLQSRRRVHLKVVLAWPTIVLTVAVVMSMIVSFFVAPELRGWAPELGMAMPAPTTALFQPLWSGLEGVTWVTVEMAFALAVVLWLTHARSVWPDRVYHWLRLDAGRWELETQMRLLPLLADAPPALQTPQAVQYLADTTPIAPLRKRLLAVVAQLRQGSALASAVQQAGLVPADALAHLQLARGTDNLPGIAQMLAAHLHARWVQACAYFERRISWIVYLLVAAQAYLLLLAVYLPIFKMGQAI